MKRIVASMGLRKPEDEAIRTKTLPPETGEFRTRAIVSFESGLTPFEPDPLSAIPARTRH